MSSYPPPIIDRRPVVNHQQQVYFSRINELDRIRKLDPVDFEKFVGDLFQRMGYAVETTVHSGDEGIDLWIEKNGEKSIVQCKRFSNQVGQPIIRDLYGEMVHCKVSRAYLVTTGTFSLPALAWAQDKSIILVDGAELCEWMKYVMPPPPPLPPPLPSQIQKPTFTYNPVKNIPIKKIITFVFVTIIVILSLITASR